MNGGYWDPEGLIDMNEECRRVLATGTCSSEEALRWRWSALRKVKNAIRDLMYAGYVAEAASLAAAYNKVIEATKGER